MAGLKKYILNLLMVTLFLGNVTSVKSEFDVKNISIKYYQSVKDFVFTHQDAFALGGAAVLLTSFIVLIGSLIKNKMAVKREACRDVVIKLLEVQGVDITTVEETKIDELVEEMVGLLNLYCCKGY